MSSAAQISPSDMERRAIEQDCLALFNRYLINADHFPDRFTDVFSEDVVWVRPSGTMHGHGEMRAFMEKVWAERRAANGQGDLTRHMLTTACVTVEDRDHASGIFYSLVYRESNYKGGTPVPMDQPELVVEYRSLFEHKTSGWLITRHEAEHVFSRYAKRD